MSDVSNFKDIFFVLELEQIDLKKLIDKGIETNLS